MDSYKQLFCNPYHVLDHNYCLAGACPEGEEMRGGSVMPSRRHVGAKQVVLSYDEGEPDPGGEKGRFSKSITQWVFETQPIKVVGNGALDSFYTARLREQELFEVVGAGKVSTYDPATGKAVEMSLLDALVKTRIAAILSAEAERPNVNLPFDVWQKQFAIDADVAKACEAPLKAIRERLASARSAGPTEPTPVDPFPLVPPTSSQSGSRKKE